MKNKYTGTQAKKYSLFAENDFSWNFLEKPFIKNFLSGNNSNKKTLDLGCGSGRSINFLKDIGFSDKNIVGVDISSELLSIAQKRFPRVKFIKSDIANLKITMSKFDVILSVMVFHFLNLKDLRKTFLECSKLLKNGGVFVFAVLHPFRYAAKDLNRYFQKTEREDLTPWGTKIKYSHKTFSDYINSLTEAGFSIMAIEEPIPNEGAKNIDLEMYMKYTSGPTRLCVACKLNR